MNLIIVGEKEYTLQALESKTVDELEEIIETIEEKILNIKNQLEKKIADKNAGLGRAPEEWFQRARQAIRLTGFSKQAVARIKRKKIREKSDKEEELIKENARLKEVIKKLGGVIWRKLWKKYWKILSFTAKELYLKEPEYILGRCAGASQGKKEDLVLKGE